MLLARAPSTRRLWTNQGGTRVPLRCLAPQRKRTDAPATATAARQRDRKAGSNRSVKPLQLPALKLRLQGPASSSLGLGGPCLSEHPPGGRSRPSRGSDRVARPPPRAPRAVEVAVRVQDTTGEDTVAFDRSADSRTRKAIPHSRRADPARLPVRIPLERRSPETASTSLLRSPRLSETRARIAKSRRAAGADSTEVVARAKPERRERCSAPTGCTLLDPRQSASSNSDLCHARRSDSPADSPSTCIEVHSVAIPESALAAGLMRSSPSAAVSMPVFSFSFLRILSMRRCRRSRAAWTRSSHSQCSDNRLHAPHAGFCSSQS